MQKAGKESKPSYDIFFSKLLNILFETFETSESWKHLEFYKFVIDFFEKERVI